MNNTVTLLECGCVNINGEIVSPKSRTARTRNKLTGHIRF